jgi:nucleoside-diphosphate-sugar epimerase
MNVAFRSEGKRVLLTGASGFTGRYVADALRGGGYEVHALRRGVSGIDLNDAHAVREVVSEIRPDKVIHLAAIAFVAHGDVDEMYRVNVLGTRNLLAALADLAKAPSHVLLASSANVYGNTEGVLSEDTNFAPQNDYAVSKLSMEYVAHLWREKLPITIVRPFNYTGVGQSEKYLIPKIVSHFRRREEVIELGNLDVSRDFYDVRLVADTYRKLLDVHAIKGTFNICSGSARTLRSVVEALEALTGHRIHLKVNPAFVRENEVRSLVGCRDRLDAVLGPAPDFCFKALLKWMLEHEA